MKSTIIREEFPENPKTALYPSEGYYAYTPSRPDQEAIARLAAMINEAEHPVFIAGNGVYCSRTGPALLALAQKIGAAVVTSYLGKGTVDETADVACGMLGTWGHPVANRILQQADLVVMLGASMGPDYTRFRDPKLVRPYDQRLVQIDQDPRNAGWVYPVELAITADVGDVVPMLEKHTLSSAKREKRLEPIRELKAKYFYDAPQGHTPSPGKVAFIDTVRELQKFLDKDDILSLDAGSSRIWMTNALRIRHQNQLLAPGGAGGMGWGGPAAAAAKLAMPEKRVTCFAGDGAFLMTADVVATCAQHNIGAVFVVANNHGLGMVRDNLGQKRIACDLEDLDFATLARGMGARGYTVSDPNMFGDVLREAHSLEGPAVIDVKIDPYDSHRLASDHEPLP